MAANVTGADIKTDLPEEGVINIEKELSLDMKDEELIELANKWEHESAKTKKELEKYAERSEKYWKGEQLDLKKLGDQAGIIDNRIFVDIETIIPAVTSQVPEPTAFPRNEDDPNEVEEAKRFEQAATLLFEESDMQSKYESLVRAWVLNRVGFLKVNWDAEHKKIRTENVRPSRLLIPPTGRTIHELPYIGEYLEKTASELMEEFPKKKKEIKEFIQEDSKGKGVLGSRLGYQVWWTNKYVFWKLGHLILDKKKNIFYDFEGSETESVDAYGERSMEKTHNNHFDEPTKPYIVMHIYNLGKQIYDDTSLIEQAIPLQDGLNKRKRQIDNNASDANGVWIIDSDRLSQKEGVQFQGTPGEKLFIPGGGGAVSRDTGRPLPAFVQDDMFDDRNEIDNIFGTHNVLRGERVGGREAAAARLVLKQADEGRLGIIARSLESVSSDLYNWWAQLIKLFGAQEMSVAMGSGDEKKGQLKFDRSIVPTGMKIRVKSGTLLPKDKNALRTEAVELWTRGALDPVTFYERLGFSNPRESAKRLFLWRFMPPQFATEYLGVQMPPPSGEEQKKKEPSLSIRFEELLPSEQAQALQHVGIQADAQRQQTSVPNEQMSPLVQMMMQQGRTANF